MQEKIEEMVGNVKEYVDTQYELAVLKATNKASHVLSELVAQVVIAFISVFAIILLSFAAAYYISTAIGDTYSGFLFMGGIYILIALLMVGLKKRFIEKPLSNKIIQSFLKEVN